MAGLAIESGVEDELQAGGEPGGTSLVSGTGSGTSQTAPVSRSLLISVR